MPRRHALFWKRRSKRVSSALRDCVTVRSLVTQPFDLERLARGRNWRKASSRDTRQRQASRRTKWQSKRATLFERIRSLESGAERDETCS